MPDENMSHSEYVANLVERYDIEQGSIISVLEEIQGKYGYLPRESLEMLAGKTHHSLVDLYGVATFYKSFSLEPRGKHLVSVCMGTACHVRGAPIIAEEFERQLNIKAGRTTEDGTFTLETVNCLGACALGPIVVVDGQYFANVNVARVQKTIKKVRNRQNAVVPSRDQRIFPVQVRCPRCNHSLMDFKNPIDEAPSIRVTFSFGRKHGWLRLSSLYGSYNLASEYEIPENRVVNFFCPHCHAELIGASNCAVCGAHMVPMIVRTGGMVQICSRRGCKGHMLDLDGVNL